jgi:phosphoribosylformylglycinamidine synthase
VGGDPAQTAILDNFCWPSCGKPENMGSLVRAAEGCYDGAKAYRTPFVSGKDSLNNQLRYTDPASGREVVIEIPPTLLITGLSLVRGLTRVTTMDAKMPGNLLVLVGTTQPHMAGSLYADMAGGEGSVEIPTVDLKLGPATARAVAQCIADGLVATAHDCSEGGMLVAVAEMLIATTGQGAGTGDSPLAQLLSSGRPLSALGAELAVSDDLLELHQMAFAESPSRYVMEVRPDDLAKVRTVLRDFGGVRLTVLGKVTGDGRLRWSAASLDAAVNDLADAWRRPLDW